MWGYIVASHIVFGILSVLASMWVLTEVIYISSKNLKRARFAAFLTAVFSWIVCILGGFVYVGYYPADKETIKNGAWPWAASIIMEIKEHAFFMLLIIAAVLPFIVLNDKILSGKNTQKLAKTVCLVIIILGLLLGTFGLIVSKAAKMNF